MKNISLTLHISLFFLISFNVNSNAQKKELISGYINFSQNIKKEVVKKEVVKREITTNISSSESKKATVNYTSNTETNLIINELDTVLFYESFSGQSLDNNWIEDSGINNMVAFFDPTLNKKVLKIHCKRPNGNSMIQIDLGNKLNGKTLKLCGLIKMEDVKVGTRIYETGQLVLKYFINDKWVYEAVQNLTGSYDWDNYFAYNDSSTDLNNTDRGPYFFHIPRTAKNVILYLGLQNCTGTIYFSDIKIIEVK